MRQSLQNKTLKTESNQKISYSMDIYLYSSFSFIKLLSNSDAYKPSSTPITLYINTYNFIIIPTMQKLSLIAVTLLLAAFAVYQSQNNQAAPALQKEPFDYLGVNEECTRTLEIECAIDVERTVVACAKAFETGGVDVIADIKCAKDLLSDKKHCWPCICSQAKKKGWHIVGC